MWKLGLILHGRAGRSVGSEAVLIRKAATGDADAFEALVIKYQRDVVRTVRFTVADVNVVDDLVQEAFLRAYRSLATFDTTRPFRNWLLTITLNVCRSHLKRRVVMLPWSERYDPPTQPAHTSDERAVLQDVLAAMSQLRYRDREILTLHYISDLTIQEAATLLSIPVGTAKSRLSKALERLRKALKYDDVFDKEGVTESGQKAHRCSTTPGSR